MKSLLFVFLMAFSTLVFSQQVPSDSAVLRRINKWKADVEKVKPESLNISYQGEKVIEQRRGICVSQLNEAATKLGSSATLVTLRSRALRHFALAAQCVDELSLNLSNSGITGGNSPQLEQFNASMNQVFSEIMRLRIQLENDLDDRIATLELRAKK